MTRGGECGIGSAAILRVAALVLLVGAVPASAQNWSFDARKIAMGNAGGADHPASKMIDEEQRYRAIVLPFGLLFQVLPDRDVFNPDSDEFDIVKAIEYAAAPLHYVVGRESASESTSGRQLSIDIRNATLSRDLNAYRGFVPSQQPVAEGLTHTTFGATIPVYRSGGTMQGIYVGAGPYFSMRTSGVIDQQLIDILGSDSDVYLRNARFGVQLDNRDQLALAIAGGYRGRFALPNGAGDRDGLYVAFDYNYLRGFRYENFDMAVNFDTDAAGLLTVSPLNPNPLFIGRDSSTSGTGFAIDTGFGLVMRGVEVGFGVKGLVNQIDWTEVERTTYALGSLFTGNDEFAEVGPLPSPDVQVELPKDYSGYAGYRAGPTFVVGEIKQGFQGTRFRAGIEQAMGRIDVRGGLLYTRDKWSPTGGVGLNLTERFSIDVAVFGSAANVQREQRLSIATSLRFNMTDAE